MARRGSECEDPDPRAVLAGGLTLGLSVTTLASVVLVGLAFAFALFRADDPEDPASGRARL